MSSAESSAGGSDCHARLSTSAFPLALCPTRPRPRRGVAAAASSREYADGEALRGS